MRKEVIKVSQEGNVFGTYLRDIRKEKGINQRQLAKHGGISYTYLSKIENNVLPPPSEETLAKFAEMLDIDKDEMFAKANKIPSELFDKIVSDIALMKVIREY
jgi:transcriptional regulator with XRE-family HTH domain